MSSSIPVSFNAEPKKHGKRRRDLIAFAKEFRDMVSLSRNSSRSVSSHIAISSRAAEDFAASTEFCARGAEAFAASP